MKSQRFTRPRYPEPVFPSWLRYPSKFNICRELLDANLERGFASRTAIRFDSKSISYFELSRMVCAMSKRLISLGIKRSERVILRMGNRPEFVASLLAIQRIGGIAIPTHPQYSRNELDFIARDGEARFAIAPDTYTDQVEHAGLERIDAALKLNLCTQDRASRRHSDIPPPVLLDADAPALILYTSGTTGRMKGCVHGHRNYLVVADIYGGKALQVTSVDRFASPASMSFAYGHVGLIAIPFRFGATTCLSDARFDPRVILEFVRKERVTIFFGVPTAYRAILPLPDSDHPATFSEAIRCCVSAGEPLGAPLANGWQKKFKIKIMEHLGSTEMLDGFIGVTRDDLPNAPPGCLGKPLHGYTARLMNAHSDTEKEMRIGELLVRGPIAIRYWNRPREQANSNWHGWNRIRDVVAVDEDGWYFYFSRADDLIKSSGYRISPHEVEQALLKHPGVSEVCVIGLPDPLRGRIVAAYVIPRKNHKSAHPTARELTEFASRHLAKYKVPRKIKIVEDLPRTVTGKISRSRLLRKETAFANGALSQ